MKLPGRVLAAVADEEPTAVTAGHLLAELHDLAEKLRLIVLEHERHAELVQLVQLASRAHQLPPMSVSGQERTRQSAGGGEQTTLDRRRVDANDREGGSLAKRRLRMCIG